jgi:hypothetical protein
MKKLIIVFCISFYAISSFAQVSQLIKQKINTELSNKIDEEHYRGNVTLTDYKEIKTNTYLVVGAFDWRFISYISSAKIEKRSFKAVVKVIFDELEITKLCYDHQYFEPYKGICSHCEFLVGTNNEPSLNMCSFKID